MALSPHSLNPETNLVACLEKFDGNSEFHEMIDFLLHCRLTFALTENSTIYKKPLEEFWESAHLVDGSLHAVVNKKDVKITITAVRAALKLQDAKGVSSFNHAEIKASMALIGYSGEFPAESTGTLMKRFFAPKFKFLVEVVLKCFSRKVSGWDQVPSRVQFILHSLVSGSNFNFSRYILEDICDVSLESRPANRIAIYPRFITLILRHIMGNDFKNAGSIFHVKVQNRKIFTNIRSFSTYRGEGSPLPETMRYNSSTSSTSSSSQPESFQKDKGSFSHAKTDHEGNRPSMEPPVSSSSHNQSGYRSPYLPDEEVTSSQQMMVDTTNLLRQSSPQSEPQSDEKISILIRKKQRVIITSSSSSSHSKATPKAAQGLSQKSLVLYTRETTLPTPSSIEPEVVEKTKLPKVTALNPVPISQTHPKDSGQAVVDSSLADEAIPSSPTFLKDEPRHLGDTRPIPAHEEVKDRDSDPLPKST